MPDQPGLFNKPPHDKQAALEAAAKAKGITVPELLQRTGIVDAASVKPRPRRCGKRRNTRKE